jgi:hypothetical protein
MVDSHCSPKSESKYDHALFIDRARAPVMGPSEWDESVAWLLESGSLAAREEKM